MNLRNIRLIWRREMRDQLRDRRTLFVIVVLPLLMYPLLGGVFFQLSQFRQQHQAVVVVGGAEQFEALPDLPPLLSDEGFTGELFSDPSQRSRMTVQRVDETPELLVETYREALASGEVDVLLGFPPGFAEGLDEVRRNLALPSTAGQPQEAPNEGLDPPSPLVLYNSGRERSQVAHQRVQELLRVWQQRVVRSNLAAGNVPAAVTQPFAVQQLDVAAPTSRDALFWSKLLPLITFVWALTGAFYPAIDLCAGEKERGTLETLLASPARRGEIVLGKLLTVMSFSIFTACLNLAGAAAMMQLLIGSISKATGGVTIAPPSINSLVWLLVALVPVAALFSALSLALAAYARSSKEGQYYFMPLLLAAMPLTVLPIMPGVELSLGNSLVPVMGLVLLLRSVIGGDMATAATYALPVIAVTLTCCWLAVKWAVTQFNQESVLFREGERFDLRRWLAALREHRGPTPSPAAAIACVGLIFLAQFASRIGLPYLAPANPGQGFLTAAMLIGQIGCIALPALLVAIAFTTNWRRSLWGDRPPRGSTVALAALLAIAMHPVGQRLAQWIREQYPLSDEVLEQLQGLGALAGENPPLWGVLGLFALLPALCEELAFRGVILSGLRKSLGDAGGVLLTAALFGATHTILQQSLAAAPIGVVLGLVALRTGSLLPCVVFHAIYNALPLLLAYYRESITEFAASWGLDGIVFTEIGSEQLGYTAPIGILGVFGAAAVLYALRRRECGLPHDPVGLRTAPSRV
ncbi:ABC transporter permease subunit/CPBP intramembrane protease [Botrimarina hoheduenensis]|uniref:ABC-2 family transporter protein n=1 Tax=Botrimarina hoheduenensis TaxID=2528000 RepID=A0A5C5VQ41_9BACT|nr:ABC transporter permease subunit/CPBP intramembrane protease [Botrimarina hoheduenensis]TWT40267.1 ABC-2 family transporter protein [Botrimarina hoheduenensis]